MPSAPLPRRRSEGSAPATLSPPHQESKAGVLFAPSTSPLRRRSSPLPPPRPLRNAVTLVEMLPMIITY